MTDKQKLAAYLKRQLPPLKAQCAQFAKEFAETPGAALSWSENVFWAAAKLELYQQIIAAAEADATTAESLCSWVEAQAKTKAASSGTSTSRPANLYTDCVRAVYADLAWGFSSLRVQLS